VLLGGYRVDINGENCPNAASPLQIAVEQKDLELVKILKNAGANAELARLTVATKLQHIFALLNKPLQPGHLMPVLLLLQSQPALPIPKASALRLLHRFSWLCQFLHQYQKSQQRPREIQRESVVCGPRPPQQSEQGSHPQGTSGTLADMSGEAAMGTYILADWNRKTVTQI